MKQRLLISFFFIICLSFLTGCNEVVNHRDIETTTVIQEPITEDEKTTLLNRIAELRYIDFYGKTIKTSNLANQEILQILNYKYNGLNNLSFSELENTALDYFNYYLNPEDLLCDTHFNLLGVSSYIYYYNNDTKTYTINQEHIKHNLIGVQVNVYDKYQNSYKENDTYTIKVYKVFSELLNSTNTNINNYYGTYNEALNKENMLFTTTGDVIAEMNNHQDKLKTYTYTFQKRSDNFILKEYTIS